MNKNLGNGFSVVMLVYNEACIIEKIVRDFYEKVIKKMRNAKFIIAEDGSTDGTKEILNELKNKIPFTLVSSKERKGYTRAFKDALHMVDTELVFFSDSDGQHEPADMFKLLKETDECDIVSGYKLPRRDPIHRVIISKAYNSLIYLLFGLKMKDINSGFKLIKKKVIDDILDEVVEFKYCVMSEFVLKAYLAGYKIKEVPVCHYPRRSGQTAIFTTRKLPSIIIGLIKSLLKIRFYRLKREKIWK